MTEKRKDHEVGKESPEKRVQSTAPEVRNEFTDRLEFENSQFRETIKIIRTAEDRVYQRAPEKEEERIDIEHREAAQADAEVDDILVRIEPQAMLVEELEGKLSDSLDELMSIHIVQSSDIAYVNYVAQQALEFQQNITNARGVVIADLPRLKAVDDHRKYLVLQEAGFEDIENLRRDRYTNNREIIRLQNKWFSEMRFGDEIDNRNIDQLAFDQALRDYGKYDKRILQCEESRYQRNARNTHRTIEEKLKLCVNERYTQHVADLPETEERTQLPESMVERLEENFLPLWIEPLLQKLREEKEERGEEIRDEDKPESEEVARLVEIVKKVGAVGENADEYHELRSEGRRLPGVLPYIFHHCVRESSETNTEYYNRLAAFVESATNPQSRVIHEASKIVQATSRWEGRSNETYQTLRNNDATQKDGRLLHELSIAHWRTFSRSPETIERFGDKIEEAESALSQKAREYFFQGSDSRRSKESTAALLLLMRDPKNAFLNIVNGFYYSSGSFGLHYLNPRLSPHLPTLGEYFENIDAASLPTDIPGLQEIVRLVRENPDTYFKPRFLEGKHNHIVKPNPVFDEIQTHIARMCVHFAEGDDTQLLEFSVRILSGSYSEFMELPVGTIEKLFDQELEWHVQDRIAQHILTTAHRQSKPGEVVGILARHSRRMSEETRSKVAATATELFSHLATSPDKDAAIDLVAAHHEIPVAEVSTLMEHAARTAHMSYFSKIDSNSFDVQRQIANTPGATESLEDLHEKKYLSEPEFVHALKTVDTDGKAHILRPYFLDLSESINPREGFNFVIDTYSSLDPESRELVAKRCIDQFATLTDHEKFDQIAPIFADGAECTTNDAYSLRDYLDQVRGVQYFCHYSPLNVQKFVNIARIPDAGKKVKMLGVEDDRRLAEITFECAERLLSVDERKLEAYIAVSRKLIASPSQEIQKIRDQLLMQVVQTDDPEETYAQIERIFLHGHLPLVGKVFLLFDAIHSEEMIDQKLHAEHCSPKLRKIGEEHEGRAQKHHAQKLIFQDLLRVHIDSDNRSLRSYMETLKDGEGALETCRSAATSSEVPGSTIDQAYYCMCKLQTLHENSCAVTSSADVEASLESQEERFSYVQEHFTALRTSVRAGDGERTSDKLIAMFAKPLGFETYEELFAHMQDVQQKANKRGRELVAENGTHIPLRPGDLLKGTQGKWVSAILQNGSVAKEFLGSSADSDLTPLDTDMSMIREQDVPTGDDIKPEDAFQSAFDKSLAKGYGDVYFCLRNRGQFQVTDETTEEFDDSKYELFETLEERQGRHFGIRTGFASTEIDFIAVEDDVMNGTDSEDMTLDSLMYEIAKNGFYIPITDTRGNVIFTPEMYDERRVAFQGLQLFDGEPIVVSHETGPVSDRFTQDIVRLQDGLKEDLEQKEVVTNHLRSHIGDVLQSGYGITLLSQFDTSMLGAKIEDTGSTGRNTNLPGKYDFDLMLKLNESPDSDTDSDYDKRREIHMALERSFEFTSNELSQVGKQMRLEGVSLVIGSQTFEIDLDIGFTRNSDKEEYASHNAIIDKLDGLSEDDRAFVTANILLAKEKLKEGEAYKAFEHGGMGGIGVENWIFMHNGNFVEACQGFLRAAEYKGPGEHRSFSEFQEHYKIRDPGVNLRNYEHDEFISGKLKEEGYFSMLHVCSQYLAA